MSLEDGVIRGLRVEAGERLVVVDDALKIPRVRLLLLVGPSTQSWALDFFQGRKRKPAIGHYLKVGGMSLAHARGVAMRVSAELLAKRDPFETVEELKGRGRGARTKLKAQAQAPAVTFGEALRAYLSWCASPATRGSTEPRKRSWQSIRGVLTRDATRWAHLPLENVTPDLIWRAGKEISGDREAPGTAQLFLKMLSAFFTWCREEERLTEMANPVRGLKKPRIYADKRILGWDELSTLWKSFEADGGPASRALQWIMLTGVRPNEALWARWTEISADGEWWNIPGSRFVDQDHRKGAFLGGMKNKDMQLVFTGTRLHRLVLEESRAAALAGPWLFPSTRRPREAPVHSLYRAVLKHREVTGIVDWSAKVLRKSMSTHMVGTLKVRRDVRSLCLAHTLKEVADIHYTAYEYAEEKADAWRRWSEALERRIYGPTEAKVLAGRWTQGH